MTVMLDGDASFVMHKVTGKVAPIKYVNGQYVFHAWAKNNKNQAQS